VGGRGHVKISKNAGVRPKFERKDSMNSGQKKGNKTFPSFQFVEESQKPRDEIKWVCLVPPVYAIGGGEKKGKRLGPPQDAERTA